MTSCGTISTAAEHTPRRAPRSCSTIPVSEFPPTEDLIETGLFSELEDGLLYLPQGAQDWLRSQSGLTGPAGGTPQRRGYVTWNSIR